MYLCIVFSERHCMHEQKGTANGLSISNSFRGKVNRFFLLYKIF